MTTVDEVEEGVGGGGLVGTFSDLAEADVIDDEQRGASPGLEANGVALIGEAGVQVVEQVDAASVADGELLLAGAQAEGFEDVALAGAALAGEDQIVVTTDEVEATELDDEVLVEGGLEVPIERLEGLALDEAADAHAPGDAGLGFFGDLGAENVLEQSAIPWPLLRGPREMLIEALGGVGQAEEGEMAPESLDEQIVGGARVLDGRAGGLSASLGHGVVS